jgi:tetratricopeptide (TPR) repeat protein
LNWGLVLADQGEYLQAEKKLFKAKELSPDMAEVYEALGMVAVKTGSMKEAQTLFEKVISLQPYSVQAHLNLGRALSDQYDLRRALEQFSEAVRLAPSSSSAHYCKSRVLYDFSMRDEAVTELETASHLAPQGPEILYLLALTERQAHNLFRSTEVLEELVALEPGHAAAQFLLGQNLSQAGRKEEAIHHWKLAVKADPENAQALYALVQVLPRDKGGESGEYAERFRARA